jgi:hypothetical protein
MPRRKRKPSLDKAALALTRIAERHLSKLPPEEQKSRVAAFARARFKGKTARSRP